MKEIGEAIEETTNLVSTLTWGQLIFIAAFVLIGIAIWKLPEIIEALK